MKPETNARGRKAMHIEQFLVLEDVEVVTVDGLKTYVVDRKRKELRNIRNLSEVLTMEQRQFGRLRDGGLEILERYQDGNPDGESVVLDSSPSWLEQLKTR